MHFLNYFLIIIIYIFIIRFEVADGFYSAFASPSASTTVTAYCMGSTSVSIYYMLTQAKRGPLGKILAGIFLSIEKDKDGEYLFTTSTKNWDGDTKLIASSLLYYYSLSVNPGLNNKYSVYSSRILPSFPWGPIDLNIDPFEGMNIIYKYIVSLNGGFIKISLTNVDIWQLYTLGVLSKYSKSRKKRCCLKKKLNKKNNNKNQQDDLNNLSEKTNIENLNVNENNNNRKFYYGRTNTSEVYINLLNDTNRNVVDNINGQRSTTKTYFRNKKLELSSVITDFNVKKKYCRGKLTIVCKSKTNSKVKYISVPWVPGTRTAFEELKVIYQYVNTLNENSLKDLCTDNKLHSNLPKFTLALILYLRERQFDSNYIDNINYRRSSLERFYNKMLKFTSCALDIFGLSHRKNSIIIAPWKNIEEEQWKLNPSKSIEYLIVGSHLQELRADRYSSAEWSEYDFVIASAVHFFNIISGVPLLYGQYISKINRGHFLVDREALNLQKYNVPVPHSVKYETYNQPA